MPLHNSAYVPTLTWANTLLTHLEKQALIPLFGENPVELGLANHEDQLLERIKNNAAYPPLWTDAYGNFDVTLSKLVHAIACFERSLTSFDSPYDRFTRGDMSAISDAAKRGQDIFFSERGECFHCHGGINFSGSVDHSGLVSAETGFFNNGLYNIDGQGGYPAPNRGLFEQTNRPRDMGAFRAPSLRNIEVTGPYMHDGSLPTLDDVIEHYNRGGVESPFKNAFVKPLNLNESEREDLKQFLLSLTDQTFLSNPTHSNPWQ